MAVKFCLRFSNIKCYNVERGPQCRSHKFKASF